MDDKDIGRFFFGADEEGAEEKGFLFVPISVNIGGREYRDGVDLTKDKFYDLLVNGGEFPQTSQPSPPGLSGTV